MHTGYLLGIDIGGTGAKAGLFSIQGELISSGYGEYRMISNVPGQAEHDADSWWLATIQAIREAIANHPVDEIRAIGVGCTNGLVAIDREGRPLRPAIMLWDQRTLPEVERVRRALDAQQVFNVTGNPVAPGAYSLPTILWLMHQEPETFSKAHKLMVPGGYIIGRLTGEFTIDFSRACTTLLFDIRRRQWHLPFLEALQVPLEKLPQPLASDEIAGVLTHSAAEMTGLKAGTPVVAGCMDTIGASIGAGVMRPGKCFVIMGTAARVALPIDQPDFDPRFMNCVHVFPDTWLAFGAINGVGSSLRWIRDNFGQIEAQVADQTDQDVYDLLTAEASQSPPGSKGLVFLPYISGERTPIWDPYARAVFFGITLGHNRSDFIRSVLEGPAFAIRQVVELLESDRQIDIQALRIGGTAAKSAIWNQIIADVTGKGVASLESAHIEVLGAALLAGKGIGLFPDLAGFQEQRVQVSREFEPDLQAHQAYSQLFSVYQDLYPSLKPFYERLAQLEISKVWIKEGISDDHR